MELAEVMPNYPENEPVQEEDAYEEENSDNNSDSDSSSEEDNNAEEDEDTYIKFVQSVFCDDYSGCSNDEEEDEEDYVPDPKEVDENDDDSDEDDRDLIRIQNRELRELVDGCWQTIVGEAPPVQPVIIKDDPIGEEIGSPQKSRAHQTYFDQTSPQNGRTSSFRNGDQSSTNPTSSDICDEMDEINEPSERGDVPSNGAKLMPIPTGVSTGPNAISSMVSKLLLENDTTEVCVEGLPVTAIRNIVARQMSMATQLLTQILLQADQDSDCFTKGYTSLMELSNLREAALKKASLVQMNFRNATAIRNHTIDLQNQKRALHSIMGSDRSDRSDFNDDDGESENDSQSEEEKEEDEEVEGEGEAVEDLLNMRNSVFGARNVTNSSNSSNNSRSASVLIESGRNHDTSLTNTVITTTPGIAVDSMRRLTRSAVQHATVHTMFNMPILGKVSTLFDMVDLSRRKIKQQLIYHRNNSQHNSISGRGSNLRAQDQQADEKAALLHAIRGQIFRIMPKLQMRAWKCLLPTLHYPLPAPLMRSLDPSTLMGRCLFTPTEDDLLLRGIMYHTGDNDWEGIRAQYMPSKVAQTLQFRYTQMTSLTATMEDNNYKRYQKLESDYRNRDSKWGPEEELQLLRAFQVLGNRWPLVRIFFLPHRKVTQLKLKWTALQKTWQRAFQGGQAATPRIGYTRELTAPMRSFLEAIRPEVNTLTPTALTLTPTSVASMVCTEPSSGVLHAAMNSSSARNCISNGVSVGSTIAPAGASMNSLHGHGTSSAVAAQVAVPQHVHSNGNISNSTSSRPTASVNAPSTAAATATAEVNHNRSINNGALQLPSISTLQVPPIMSTLALPFPSNSTTNKPTNNTNTTNAATANNTTATATAQQHNQQQLLLQQQMQLQMQQYQQMYPYMPSFMMPGAALKMPTTQEEFLVYQQQMQFQQFMQQQQYQMFLQQQQMMQQLNPSEANSGTNGINNSNLQAQMQQMQQMQQQMQLQQQQLLAQHMQNINPNITIPAGGITSNTGGSISSNNSSNSNNNTNRVTSHNTTTNNSVPSLLPKPLSEEPINTNSTTSNNTSNTTSGNNKRTRRIRPDLVAVDPELRSPSSSLLGLLQDKDKNRTRTTSTNSNNNRNGSEGASGNTNNSESSDDPHASRSVSFLLNRANSSQSQSASQYHDLYQNQHLSSNQDSIFSLLCAGDSVPFGEALSVPYLESSEQSSSSSNEPFPALSKQIQPTGVAASGKNNNTNSTTTATAPTLKGILSKSPSKKKKKTIKPTLISAATATAGAAASHVFDAPSTTNNNNNPRTLSANSKTIAMTSSRSKAPTTVPHSINNTITTSTSHQNNNNNTLGSLYGEVSLSGLEGLSCLQWGDASQAVYDSYSASNSASNSSGADDTRLSALGGPILADMSLLDASRFSFSNFAPPRFDSYSDDSHQANDNSSRASKSGSKNASKNGSKSASKSKKSGEDSQSASRSESKKNSSKNNSEGKHVTKKAVTTTNNAEGSSSNQIKPTASAVSRSGPAASFSSPLRNNLGSPLRTMYTRSALTSPAAAGSGVNGGGDNGALYPFDETSNMSLLGDLFGDGDFSTQNPAGNLLSPLRSHSKPPLHASWSSPQAQRRPSTITNETSSSSSATNNSKKRSHAAVTSGDIARPFQNISARPGIASQSSTSATQSNHSSTSNSSSHRGIGPSPKKQKKTGGLFAEVMAKAQR